MHLNPALFSDDALRGMPVYGRTVHHPATPLLLASFALRKIHVWACLFEMADLFEMLWGLLVATLSLSCGDNADHTA
jgi:hypothetical protein